MQIADIAIDNFLDLPGLLVKGAEIVLREIAGIQRRIEPANDLVHRTSGNAAELNILMVMEAPAAFSDVRGYRYCSPAELLGKTVTLFSREGLRNIVDRLAQPPRQLQAFSSSNPLLMGHIVTSWLAVSM